MGQSLQHAGLNYNRTSILEEEQIQDAKPE